MRINWGVDAYYLGGVWLSLTLKYYNLGAKTKLNYYILKTTKLITMQF